MMTGILLSAGLSSRFGSPKALANIQSTPAILVVIESMFSAGLDQIIVVLGADAPMIEPCLFKHKSLTVVHNKDYKFGQTSSVQTGLRFTKASCDFMLFPVDCPFIKPSSIRMLVEDFTKTRPLILVPTHNGRRGHPPVFAHPLKDEILALDPNTGLNVFMHTHNDAVRTMALDDAGVTASFNTPAEFNSIKAEMGIA